MPLAYYTQADDVVSYAGNAHAFSKWHEGSMSENTFFRSAIFHDKPTAGEGYVIETTSHVVYIAYKRFHEMFAFIPSFPQSLAHITRHIEGNGR